MKRCLLCCQTVSLALLLVTCGPEAPPIEMEPDQDEARRVSPIYREIAAQAGLTFNHFNGATGKFFFPEIMGSGVALLDYDGDGDLDVYLVQGNAVDPEGWRGQALIPPPEDQPSGNRLFRNELMQIGTLQFTDVTESAGVGNQAIGMGVAVGGVKNTVNPAQRSLWFLGQICAGGHTMGLLFWSRHIENPPEEQKAELIAYGRSEEVSIVYTAICGMLNILIIFDVVARAEKQTVVSRRGPPP